MTKRINHEHHMLHPIHGFVHPRFEAVKTAFNENFTLRGEIGASVCIYHKGEKVVDLWGGFADQEATQPWQANDLTTLFSVTKGLVATCYLILVDRGKIKYSDPVEQYWPELCVGLAQERYRAERKKLTIAELLNHRSGLLGFKDTLSLETLEDEAKLLERLESEPLRWKPNSQQGYHGVSFGLYAGALFKKITGQSLGRFIRNEIREKLDIDVYLGLSQQETQLLSQRIRPIFPNQVGDILSGILPSLLMTNREGNFYRAALNKASHTAFAFGQPADLGARGLKNFNQTRVQQLELPWANGLGSARSIAKLYQALLTPHRLVSPQTLALVFPRQSWSKRDAVIKKPMGFSYGFVKEETILFSPNPEAFGHPGAGGALGFADPKAELSIAYVMNRMGYQVRSPRALALCHAAHSCLS